MDLLTGKAKTDFEAWMYYNYTELIEGHSGYTNYLNDIAIVAKNAHIIEWLDSVGIFMYIAVVDLREYVNYSVIINDKDVNTDGVDYKCRTEATEAAITKAVVLYNEKV